VHGRALPAVSPLVTTVGPFDPPTGTRYLKNSDTVGAIAIGPFRYSAPGRLPVVGAWDCDGTPTVGVFYPGRAT
jgi:hypothetical protein